MSRHALPEAAQIICAGADLKLPELWVARRLRTGVFTGIRIGRNWFMTDADIDAAIESCRREQPRPVVEDVPLSVIAGLSERAARRLRAS